MVIPKSLQEQVISICHEGHLEIVKTKQLLRSRVWFPGMRRAWKEKSLAAYPARPVPTVSNVNL